MVNRVPTGNTFHAYFNPDRDMPAAAEAVHGLSISFLSDKPRFHERVGELLEFLGEETKLVAHNAGFDFGFVNSELEMCGLPPLGRERMIDTVAMARMRHPGAKNSLDALCTRYGIDRSHRTRHGALLDAELLAQVYVELTGGRQIGLSLAAEAEVSLIQIESVPKRDRPFRPARPHQASEAERAAHAAFLETVKSPLWTN
jgi:DNA polymerase-3 subunit epsilon